MAKSIGPPGASSESARSEATCRRLIDAAFRLFSRQGFDAVSTRALASAANVNQAAIPYHFRSKEGLYNAVAKHITEMVGPSLDPVANAVREHHRDGVTDLYQAREDVVALILALLRKITMDRNRYEIGFFMLREQMQPTAAMDLLYEGVIRPFHELLGRLVAALRGIAENDPDVIIEVQVLYGEAIVFGVHRTTLVRRLGVDSLDDGHLERINRVVRAMVMRQFPLEGPINFRDQPR